MKKICLMLLSGLLSLNAIANEIEVQVYDLLSPKSKDAPFLLLAGDGLVYEVSASDTDLIDIINDAKLTKSFVTIKTGLLSTIKDSLDKRLTVVDVQMFSSEEEVNGNKNFMGEIPTPLDGYSVTVSEDEDIQSKFYTMRTRTKRRSQCYNRAHVWTYELNKRYGTESGKIWLFFTRKYIDEYDYKWWFHVAPYMESFKDGSTVMDRKFTSAPKKLEDWKNIFMYNNAPCPTIQYYSQYNNNQRSKYCYIIKSSMYYWQPFQIENLEKGEEEKTQWNEGELRRAYRNAIRGWDGDL